MVQGCSLPLALLIEEELPREGVARLVPGPAAGARIGLLRAGRELPDSPGQRMGAPAPGTIRARAGRDNARRSATYGDELSKSTPRVRNGVRNTRIWAQMLGLSDTVIEDVELLDQPVTVGTIDDELHVVVHVRAANRPPPAPNHPHNWVTNRTPWPSGRHL